MVDAIQLQKMEKDFMLRFGIKLMEIEIEAPVEMIRLDLYQAYLRINAFSKELGERSC